MQLAPRLIFFCTRIYTRAVSVSHAPFVCSASNRCIRRAMSLGIDESNLCAVTATGDVEGVRRLVREGADVNQCSSEGFYPLCVAAFWGYADMVKVLLGAGADVNVANRGTGWTASHCAAFQGHGKVLLQLMQQAPDVTLTDNMGRTAADFGSALETVWPFFAALGCQRTPKAELIRMDIIKRVEGVKGQPSPVASMQGMREVSARFSRPGSSYVLQSQPLGQSQKTQESAAALAFGDVLRSPEKTRSSLPQPSSIQSQPQMNIYRR